MKYEYEKKLGYVCTKTAVWIYWQAQNTGEVLSLIAALVVPCFEAKQKENKEKSLQIGHV